MGGIEDLQGCGTALVTPFKANGELDETALADFVDFQIEGGVDFLVPCGTTGETPSLAMSEQLRVVEIVMERSGGRLPIIVGAGGNCTSKVIAAAKQFSDIGVDGLLSVTPYYNKPSQEGLYRHYAALSEAVSTPIVLYNVPGRTGANLLPETVLRLAELEGIIGIKEASASVAQMTEIATRMPRGFKLLSGDDGFVLPLIAIGGCGVISVVSNIAPRQMSELTHLCLAGRFDAARQRQRQIHELTKACFLETNPIPAKAALAIMGRIQEQYRLPMVAMERENRRQLEEVLSREGLLDA